MFRATEGVSDDLYDVWTSAGSLNADHTEYITSNLSPRGVYKSNVIDIWRPVSKIFINRIS